MGMDLNLKDEHPSSKTLPGIAFTDADAAHGYTYRDTENIM